MTNLWGKKCRCRSFPFAWNYDVFQGRSSSHR
jgi:hypothetical protein